MNQGPFAPETWKNGGNFNAPAGSKIWNPVKLKMMKGEKVTGGTVFNSTEPAVYCAMANAGYDFIWTEMQHDQKNWSEVTKMWATCPYARAVPGTRVAYTDEKEIQHATDSGAPDSSTDANSEVATDSADSSDSQDASDGATETSDAPPGDTSDADETDGG